MNARVVFNHALTNDCYHMQLTCTEPLNNVSPGQFIMLAVSTASAPLWRRPFGIFAMPDSSTIEIIYQVVGQGTEIMRCWNEGHKTDLLGPFGNGFTLHNEDTTIAVVAGGMGIAPTASLIRRAAEQGITVHCIFGARTKQYLFFKDTLADCNGVMLHTATDDGSEGFHGHAADLYKTIADQFPDINRVYCCGPEIMMRAVVEAVKTNKHKIVPIQVSIENRMACGFGVCMGCISRVNGEYIRTCKEGPVIDGLHWD